MFKKYEIGFNKKIGDFALSIWGDLDCNKNSYKIVKILELLIQKDSLISADCFIENRDLFINEAKEINELEISYKKNIRNHDMADLKFKTKSLFELIKLAEKYDVTLGFRCEADGVSGAINDYDGTFLSVSKTNYEKHMNAIKAILKT